MSDTELNRLRLLTLQFFLYEAQTPGSFLDLPEMKAYRRRWLRAFLQAMSLAGLLDRWGATAGRQYRTSHLGYIVMVVLDEMMRT